MTRQMRKLRAKATRRAKKHLKKVDYTDGIDGKFYLVLKNGIRLKTTRQLTNAIYYAMCGDENALVVLGTICNGCGPASWRFDIVPDKPLWWDFTWPCDDHDYRYFLGDGKDQADDAARDNWATVAAETRFPWFVPRWLRNRLRAKKSIVVAGFYAAVSSDMGDEPYKNAKSEALKMLVASGVSINYLKAMSMV